jgi:hypothetical protein
MSGCASTTTRVEPLFDLWFLSGNFSAIADGQHVPNVGRQCYLYLPLGGHAGLTAGLDALNSG